MKVRLVSREKRSNIYSNIPEEVTPCHTAPAKERNCFVCNTMTIVQHVSQVLSSANLDLVFVKCLDRYTTAHVSQ